MNCWCLQLSKFVQCFVFFLVLCSSSVSDDDDVYESGRLIVLVSAAPLSCSTVPEVEG